MGSKSGHFGANEVSVDAIEAAAEVARGMDSKEDELLTVIGRTGTVWSVIGVDHNIKFPPDDEIDPLIEAVPESSEIPPTAISW